MTTRKQDLARFLRERFPSHSISIKPAEFRYCFCLKNFTIPCFYVKVTSKETRIEENPTSPRWRRPVRVGLEDHDQIRDLLRQNGFCAERTFAFADGVIVMDVERDEWPLNDYRSIGRWWATPELAEERKQRLFGKKVA